MALDRKPRLQMWLRVFWELPRISPLPATFHSQWMLPTGSAEVASRYRQTGRDLKAFRNLRHPMMPSDIPSILRRKRLMTTCWSFFCRRSLASRGSQPRLIAAGDSSKMSSRLFWPPRSFLKKGSASIGSQWVLTNVLEILSKLEEPETISVLLDPSAADPQGEALYLQVLEFLLNHKEEAAEAAAAKLKESA